MTMMRRVDLLKPCGARRKRLLPEHPLGMLAGAALRTSAMDLACARRPDLVRGAVQTRRRCAERLGTDAAQLLDHGVDLVLVLDLELRKDKQ